MRPAPLGTLPLLLSTATCLVLFAGCARDQSLHSSQNGLTVPVAHSPVEPSRLTHAEDEVAYLQIVQERIPERAADEPFLRLVLGKYRQHKLRVQALSIQFRHQYPSATEGEIAVLARDAVTREENERQDAITRTILSAPPTSAGPPSMHCFSDRIFRTTYTDCY